jgi:hypothetical protein
VYYLGNVHRLVFWKHLKHKNIPFRPKIHAKYSNQSTGTKCKNIFLHILFAPRQNRANYKKGAHQLPTLKKNITMVEPFAWSSGMAMV